MDTTSEQPFLEELRRKRGELRGSMSALEHALASPAGGPTRAVATFPKHESAG